jgi:hypothetical protein
MSISLPGGPTATLMTSTSAMWEVPTGIWYINQIPRSRYLGHLVKRVISLIKLKGRGSWLLHPSSIPARPGLYLATVQICYWSMSDSPQCCYDVGIVGLIYLLFYAKLGHCCTVIGLSVFDVDAYDISICQTLLPRLSAECASQCVSQLCPYKYSHTVWLLYPNTGPFSSRVDGAYYQTIALFSWCA